MLSQATSHQSPVTSPPVQVQVQFTEELFGCMQYDDTGRDLRKAGEIVR